MPTYGYRCPLGHEVERARPVGRAPKRVRCDVCGRRAVRVFGCAGVVVGADKRADAAVAAERNRRGREWEDYTQGKMVERAFAEGNVTEYRPPKRPGCTYTPDIDHARRMGPGRKGVLPEPKKRPLPPPAIKVEAVPRGGG